MPYRLSRAARAIAAAVVVLPGLAHGQTAAAHPDFSGAWVVVAPVAPRGAGPRAGGPVVQPPVKTFDVRPVYPRPAMEERIVGNVIIQMRIEQQGTVSNLRVLRSLPGLDEAAVEAVSQWMYDSVPDGTVATTVVTTTFSLGQPSSGPRGRGSAPPPVLTLDIAQNDRELKLTERLGNFASEVTYRLDGQERRARPKTAETARTYVTRWDGDRLVTTATSTKPDLATRVETMWIEGETLVIERTIARSGAPVTWRTVYGRAR